MSINISNWTVASASLCPLLACLPTCSHPCPTLPSKGDPLGFPPSSSSDHYITQPLLAVLVSWLRGSFLVGGPSFSFQISSPHMAQFRVMFTLLGFLYGLKLTVTSYSLIPNINLPLPAVLEFRSVSASPAFVAQGNIDTSIITTFSLTV